MTIAHKASTKAQGTSVTLPTHATGDMLVMVAIGSSVLPTVPSGWTTIQSGGVTLAAYQVATSSGGTSGTWTNAVALACESYSGSNLTIGASTQNSNGGSYTLQFASLIMAHAPCWVLAFVGEGNGGTTNNPTGMAQRQQQVASNGSSTVETWDTNGTVSIWSGGSVSQNYQSFRVLTFELYEAGPATDSSALTANGVGTASVASSYGQLSAGATGTGTLSGLGIPQPAAAGLRAVSISSTGAILTWLTQPGVTYWSVWRDDVLLAVVQGDFYIDTGLTPGTQHSYTVRQNG